jgi:hypothetical protein
VGGWASAAATAGAGGGRTTTEPPVRTDGAAAPPPERFSTPAQWSYATIGTYVVIAVLLVLTARASLVSKVPYVSDILALLFAVFLLRYLSTRYWLDTDHLTAWRLFGSRHVRYDHVRRIEFGNLRDLAPVGFFGAWGWRGRMWSPVLGKFDSVHTISMGLVVTGGEVPLFISPRDPPGFARELSRRVRSVTGPLDVDVGAPRPASSES